MPRFVTLINGIDGTLRVFLVVMMALLVIDVSWQILTRFVLPKPSSFTEELARFLLIWISLIGGAYTYRLHSHLGFDLLVRKMSKVRAVLVFRLSCLLVAVFAIAVLLIGGSNLVYLTWLLGQSSPVLELPMAFIYLAIPLSGILFLIYSSYFFVDANNQTLGETSE
ncbi:TRAP transporter small permease [Rheinheimera sp. UJ51]|uniref:TRAP transporter small permease n=1 Tax=unclassified Rheinheimera TaxID=115860 RepID=UPI001E51764B|nr:MULTISPECIES: TRAP transporter small permease [unclassified Rheinheimera]MCC5453281.1 TRAP transporter small permease [Rheinheimera sp. UJ51]MCF4010945.1 TRAP transporter small permease [Rheinheimera sp. UJ63]